MRHLLALFLFLPFPLWADGIFESRIQTLLMETGEDLENPQKELKEDLSQEEKLLFELTRLIRLYQDQGKNSYLRHARQSLDALSDISTDFSYTVRGVIQAYTARERTAFGMKNLREMETLFTKISENPSPVVRFLRAMTLMELSLGLPKISPLANHIEKAENMAMEDFRYLQEDSSLPEPLQEAYRPYLQNTPLP